MEDQITVELIEQYDVATPEEQYQMDEMMEEFDMVMSFDLPMEDFFRVRFFQFLFYTFTSEIFLELSP